VKGLDATDVHCIIDNSFLEANHAIVIDLCDLVGISAFQQRCVSEGAVMSASRQILASVVLVNWRFFVVVGCVPSPTSVFC
jgi:hypothetical protein